jgi:hypothetical protein
LLLVCTTTSHCTRCDSRIVGHGSSSSSSWRSRGYSSRIGDSRIGPRAGYELSTCMPLSKHIAQRLA